MNSLRCSLLLANGGLYDPNFRQTVVLVVEHDESGALGLVLNRPMPASVTAAAPALASLATPDERLFAGGPVQPEAAVVLVESADPALGGKPVFGLVRVLLEDPSDRGGGGIMRGRVFAGYAGWGPGQLKREIEALDWIAEPATAGDVFSDEPENLWRKILTRKGHPYKLLATMPFDPTTN